MRAHAKGMQGRLPLVRTRASRRWQSVTGLCKDDVQLFFLGPNVACAAQLQSAQWHLQLLCGHLIAARFQSATAGDASPAAGHSREQWYTLGLHPLLLAALISRAASCLVISALRWPPSFLCPFTQPSVWVGRPRNRLGGTTHQPCRPPHPLVHRGHTAVLITESRGVMHPHTPPSFAEPLGPAQRGPMRPECYICGFGQTKQNACSGHP